MCGKDQFLMIKTLHSWGSPPHVRERPTCGEIRISVFGITPACAGKTDIAVIYPPDRKDHPRMCGKDVLIVFINNTNSGSPPHVRERLDALYFLA